MTCWRLGFPCVGYLERKDYFCCCFYTKITQSNFSALQRVLSSQDRKNPHCSSFWSQVLHEPEAPRGLESKQPEVSISVPVYPMNGKPTRAGDRDNWPGLMRLFEMLDWTNLAHLNFLFYNCVDQGDFRRLFPVAKIISSIKQSASEHTHPSKPGSDVTFCIQTSACLITLGPHNIYFYYETDRTTLWDSQMQVRSYSSSLCICSRTKQGTSYTSSVWTNGWLSHFINISFLP